MTNKKGNINELMPAVMGLILAGVLLVIGLAVLGSFQDVSYVTTSANVINESLSIANDTGVTLLTGFNAKDGVCGAVSFIVNGTIAAGKPIALGNITQVGCSIYNATDLGVFNSSTVFRYTYPYTFSNSTVTTTALGSTNTSLASLASTWLPIIVVVLAAGIVLSILLGAFAGKKK